MNDHDEDGDAERQLNSRMQTISGLPPPKLTFVAPAALYLTAILECVFSFPFLSLLTSHSSPQIRLRVSCSCALIFLCSDKYDRHVLSNVGRVVARDSGRVVAAAQDLFVALCEDSTFYSTFKSMKGIYS